jgi:hypothetical protein
MRRSLLLALVAVPLACAAVPRTAAAQRDHRGHGRVYVYRDGRGYRDRIYISSSHRYKEPQVGYRSRDYGYRNRDRDAYRYRRGHDSRYDDGYRYRQGYGYRDRSSYRRRGFNLVDLLMLAAGRHDSRDGYQYQNRGRNGCRHGGRHIVL